MRFSRLAKIKGYWVFRDFAWPGNLPAFARYNVIYGWNGAGKTAISSLFQSLQDRQALTTGEVEFELRDGSKISRLDTPPANAPQIRVFNRDFVARTVASISHESIAPIYYLGEESIEQQKKVEQLKEDLRIAWDEVSKADRVTQRTEKELSEFCIEKAKLIKEALRGSADHANYNKSTFRTAADARRSASPQPHALSDKEKGHLRKQKDLKPQPSITKVSVSVPDLAELRTKTLAILERTIVSEVIDELVSDPEVGSWVQRGLSLHEGERETNTCRFCGNPLSQQRRAELAAHFNDAFAAFQRELDQAIGSIMSQRQALLDVSFPDSSRFYPVLRDDAESAVKAVRESIKSVNEELGLLKGALERKKASPFTICKLDETEDADQTTSAECTSANKETETTEAADTESFQEALDKLNELIKKHEATTASLNSEISKAYKALEQDLILEALTKYKSLTTAATDAETKLTAAKTKPTELAEEIARIEKEIVKHRRPAEELTEELRAYLGRDELVFEVEATGYKLTRGGEPALHLSEGERTAISFLYFLKSLEDKDFSLPDGVVVIDDPVSSLDSNALFSAFGYMKERAKECDQLFILTHNFAFFRQVKNWFHYLNRSKKPKKIEERGGRLYSLWATVCDGRRSAGLYPIDPLLQNFESEYHFLFKQVHNVANEGSSADGLTAYYGIPNIARRLLETFLAHRYPDCDGDLIRRFDRVDFDPAKKTRILRLLNTYSHSGGITDPEHDPSALAETGDVIKMILELIQTVDDDHYQGMIKLMQPTEAEE